MRIKDSAKSKKISTCIKNTYWKFREVIATRSKIAPSGVTVLKSQFFSWNSKVSKARNTTIKMIYIIKLYISRPIFYFFFYDILHCATQQNNFRPLYNVGKHHTPVQNSNYRALVFFVFVIAYFTIPFWIRKLWNVLWSKISNRFINSKAIIQNP